MLISHFHSLIHSSIHWRSWTFCTAVPYKFPVEIELVTERCRSSPTGEGIFVFSSWQNEQIYQTVHRASTTIAESVRIARTTSEVSQVAHSTRHGHSG